MVQKYLHIELGNDGYMLDFQIANHQLAQRWLRRMALRHDYVLDDPSRFYGFDSFDVEKHRAITLIENCINTINGYQHIIQRPFELSQDCLNYLHHVFERYHGLLNKQDHEFWNTAPDTVRKALAELNIAVHRCEALQRDPEPRLVCTWFGLPKTETVLDNDLQQHGTTNPQWGSVCLNYCEIGKTLEDLTRDLDNYISEEAFLPFNHFSADFVVYFYEETKEQVLARIDKMREFFDNQIDFFQRRGYVTIHDPRLQPLKLPVAQLIQRTSRESILQEIQKRQFVNRVIIDETSNHSST